MLTEWITIIIGFAFLVYGAEVLIRGCSDIAKKFHIPEFIIGLTIVAIGTSMPELIITINSALKGHTDLIIGNALGSNLCNLLLILGLISIINPVKIDKETRKIHLPIAIISVMMLIIIVNGFLGTTRHMINKLEGVILLLFAIGYFIYPLYIEVKDIRKTNASEKNDSKAKKHKKEIKILKAIFNIIVGIILLKYGSDFVVDNATLIATRFGISESVIGLTIIAIGTALPEMVTSLVAVIKKDTDMAVRQSNWLMCFKLMHDTWYRGTYYSF